MLFTKSTATKVASVGIWRLLFYKSFLISINEVAKIVISASEAWALTKSTTNKPYLAYVIYILYESV